MGLINFASTVFIGRFLHNIQVREVGGFEFQIWENLVYYNMLSSEIKSLAIGDQREKQFHPQQDER